MGRVNDDQWLDEALNKAIHSDDTRPDFQKWKADHPEAVEMLTSRTRSPGQRPHRIWRTSMNTHYVKIAAAAVIAVAGIVGVTWLTHHPADNPSPGEPVTQETVVGPTTCMFADGSSARLCEGASIRTLATAEKRGFAHVAGRVEVTVAKGHGEFIVTTPYGEVKALGTQFTVDMVDAMDAQTRQQVKLLSVEVTEGSVEVRNAKGAKTLGERQNVVVGMDSAPYDFRQDETLPARLRERIVAMLEALEANNATAYIANGNVQYMFKLVKGQESYDPQRFGGNEADLERLRQGFGDVASPQELVQRFIDSGGFKGSRKLYVRVVELSKDGKHAQANCIRYKSENSVVITTPQWHFFDDDWWQIDD
ncbi:MAG: FecR domain-containing protein [Phycisphaerae bacterium]|nr:FecR domain-containing protein [Phycisphaerae bacterium]